MSDAIGLYLNEIGKVALLNAEDERNLSKAIEKGRDAAAAMKKGERGAALRAKSGVARVGRSGRYLALL